MRQVENAKAHFIRMMVHELKAPVAAVKMLADALLYNEAVADTSAAAVVTRMSQRLGRLTELINDLLDLAWVKSGDPLGGIGMTDLRAETERGCAQYRDQAEQKGLTLHVDLPRDPIHACFDSLGYRLVISNLISNAVKYTQTGSITVSLEEQGGWVELTVADTGIGIPEADVPRLFTEFFRASNAKASEIEGSGVGLAGVKSLVERFGGELAFETRENEGSTFKVWLRVPSRESIAPKVMLRAG
jgi:signal transduction histidine kinase